MAKNKYEIARGYYPSPAQSYERDPDSGANGKDVSADTAQRYLMAVRDIVGEYIEKRIRNGQDIAKVYNAEITSMATRTAEVGSVLVPVGADGGSEQRSVTAVVPERITVRYNDDDYTDIANGTVRTLSVNDKWCKICTYDGVQFFVLHRL